MYYHIMYMLTLMKVADVIIIQVVIRCGSCRRKIILILALNSTIHGIEILYSQPPIKGAFHM